MNKTHKMVLSVFLIIFVILAGITSYQYFTLSNLRAQVDEKISLIKQDKILLSLQEIQTLYESNKVLETNAASYYKKAYSTLSSRGVFAPEIDSSEESIVKFLKTNADVLQLIEEGNQYPCYTDLKITDGSSLELSHLTSTRQIVKMLCYRSDYESKTNIDQSIQTLQTLEKFLRSLDNEPLIISFLVNITMKSLLLETILDLINKHQLDPQQLAKLEKLIPGELSLDQCYYFDMAVTIDLLENFSVTNFYKYFNSMGISNTYPYTERYYEDYLAYLDIMHELILALRQPATHLKTAIGPIGSKIKTTRSQDFIVASLATPSAPDIVAKYLNYIELINITKTALFLERYHRDHNNYPKDLSSLVPKYTADIPLDINTSKPISYKRKSDKQYLLYSFGVNGIDDSSVLPTNIKKNDDIVFEKN